MYPETNQQRNAAISTKAMLRIRRVRSSSRCSRNDICPPRSSESFSSFDLIRRKRAIQQQRTKDFGLEPLVFAVRLLFGWRGFGEYRLSRLHQRRIDRCDRRGDGLGRGGNAGGIKRCGFAGGANFLGRFIEK